MYALKPRNAWQELTQFQDAMQQLFGRSTAASGGTHWPQFNVWSNENEVIVTSELPGIDPEKLDVNVTQDLLTVAGSMEQEDLQENESFQRRERLTKQFERTLKLPFVVNSDQAEANYKHGVLEIRLHRPEEEKPRKLTVQAG